MIFNRKLLKGDCIASRTLCPNFDSVKTSLILMLLLACLLISGCRHRPEPDLATVTKITFWHGINPPENRIVFQTLVDRFNQEHKDLEVEALYIGQPDAQLPKILAATVSEQPPDLLWYVPQIAGKLNRLGALLPLEDWLDRSAIKSAIDPAMFDSMQLDGHILSVPFATNNAAVFYRPSLFAAAGITQLPTTWSALKQTAQQLTTEDSNRRLNRHGIFLSLGKGEWNVFTWLPFIYSAGGNLLTERQPDLVNPGAIAALQFGADLVQSGVALLSPPERGYEIDEFIAGKVAMQITGPWTLAQLKSAKIDYGVFPIPRDKQPAAVMGGENLFAFKTTPKREHASLEFLEYVLSEEFQTAWALKTGYLPVNIKSQQSKAYQDFVAANPVIQVFLDQMQWAKSRPIIPEYNRLSENLGRAIEASLLRKLTPEAALRRSQQRLELIFGNS